jgi:xylulokinase
MSAPRDREALIGVDVGTTNVKAAAYAVDGRVLAVASERLPVLHPRPGWSEYDPETLFGSAVAVIRRVLAGVPDARPLGVAVASMAETAVPLGGDGRPLHRAVAWHDERAREQADWWREAVGAEAVYAVTGLPILPIFGINKLLWFRQHAPVEYARMRAWLNVADYVAYRLCGVQACDHSLASRLMVFDLRARRWSDDLLTACEVDPSVLPEVIESGQRLGGVHHEGEAATGLPIGTPVAAGGHDHPCGGFALGLTEPGDVLDSIGTAESLLTVVVAPRLGGDMAATGYQQGLHVAAGRYYCNGGLFTAGACVEWLRSLIADESPEPYAALGAWAAESPVGSRGVAFLPHLRLANPPIVDLDARAAFVGLTAAATRGDLARAVTEGMAFEAQASLDGLASRMGLPVGRVRAIGGGTRHRLLMRVKATLLGAPIEVAVHDEVTTLGAALLAGVGAGVYPSTAEAPSHVELDFDTVAPVTGWRERYARIYRDVYRLLYPQLRDLHRVIADLERASAADRGTYAGDARDPDA